MGKLSYNTKHKIKLAIGLGAFGTAFAGIGGFATCHFIEANNRKVEFDLSDLPLMENQAGNKVYNKMKNCSLVLTTQFEKEFFKNKEDDEKKLAMIGLKSAVDSFNALTNYYHYSLFAESEAFSSYGIHKNKSNNKIIPITFGDDPEQIDIAETTLYTAKNGEVLKAEIRFTERAVFSVYNIFDDEDKMFAPENSGFYAVAQHEFGHLTGRADVKYSDIFNESGEKEFNTIMGENLYCQSRTYTDYDKATINELVNRIDKTKQINKDEEIEK